jgi:gliding motility-associated-like protein
LLPFPIFYVTLQSTNDQMRRSLHFICIVSVLFALCKNAIAQGTQTVKTGTATTPVSFPGTGCFYSWNNDTESIGLNVSGAGNIPSFTAINKGNAPVTATITGTLVPPSAYVANVGDNTVSVINTATQKVTATIQVGNSPIGVSVSPDGSRVYVAVVGATAGGVAVINTATNTVITTVPITYYPNNVLVSPDGTKVYVTNGHNLLNVISTATNTITGSVVLNSPFPIAISPDGTKLYAGSESGNIIYVINAANNQIIATIPVGSEPNAAAVTPDGTKLYVSNYSSGNVSVINTATNKVIATVPLGSFAVDMAMSPDGSVVYVGGAANENGVSVISTTSNTVIYTIGLNQEPYGICTTPDGTQLYVANANNNTVSIIDTKTYATLANIAVGEGPNSHGNFITGGAGCSTTPLKYTITVNPAAATPPSITTSIATGDISACAGTASVSPNIQQFTVSGTNLTGNITATAPTGFLVSLAQGSGYSNSIIVPESGGSAVNTTVYVSSSATAPLRNISGNVALTSPGAGSQNVTVNGTVNALPDVDIVSPQTVYNGDNTAAINFTGTGNQYTWTNDMPGIGLAASGVGDIASFTAVNTGSTSVKATITATPEKIGYVYISNAGSNDVSVISTLTNTVVDNITVGEGPGAVATSPDGTRVYVANGFNISVINTATNTVTATIPTISGIVYLYVSPDNSRLYMVSDAAPQSIWIFNTATDAVISTIPLTTFLAPGYLTVSANGNFIYIVNQAGSVAVINATTYQTIVTIPVGASPYDITINPSGSLVYVANSNSNSVSVINTATNTVVSTIPTGISPQALVVSPDGSTLYVANKGSNTVSVINTVTNMVVATIPTGSGTWGISINSDGSEVYLDMSSTNSVLVINTATNTVTSTINGFSRPFSSGNFITPGSDCPGPPVTFTITVNPTAATPPAITVTTATGTISVCSGTASVSPNIQQFMVSGTYLTGGITATAPAGFEISLTSGSGFTNSVMIPETSGTATNTTVYVSSSATAPLGNISGNVMLTSPGAASQTVTVAATVNALPALNKVSPQAVSSGTNTTVVNFTGTANTTTWTNDMPGIGLAAYGSGNIPSFSAVNTGSSPVTATIIVTPRPSDFAYISNTHSNSVSVINTATNTLVATVPVGSQPQGVAVSPDNGYVYIANSTANTVSVINTATNTVTATIPVGQSPQAVSVSYDGSQVYVCNIFDGSVSVIASASNMVTATITGFIQPYALAASPVSHILFVANVSGTVSVVNTSSNTIQQAINVGQDPYQIIVSPDGSRVYVTNFSSNTVSVINTATYSVVNTIDVGSGPGGLAISPDGSFLYVSCYFGGNVTVINTSSGQIVQTININSPIGISATADGKEVYVVNNPPGGPTGSTNTVTIISTATNSVVTTAPVGLAPNSLGNFMAAGTGCIGTPVTFTITVNPSATPPTIVAGNATGNITACEGTASIAPDIQQFTVSGSNLTGDITATAPTDFEISFNAGIGFGPSVTISQSAGTVTNATLYVRSAATAPSGPISDNVSITSPGAATQQVTVSGTVNALPVAEPVPSQTLDGGTATTAVDFTGTGNLFTWINDTPAIGLPASGSGNIAPFTTTNTGNSPLTATITVTPASATAAYAYIPASNSPGTVSVVSIAQNTVVKDITVGNAPGCVAVNPGGSTVYVGNSFSNTVSVISTATNTVVATVAVGKNPSGICVSADGSKVYVADYNDGTITVIDAATNSVTATIGGFQRPGALAISPNGSKLYVCCSGGISVVGTAGNNIEASIAGSADQIAISPDGSTVYVTDENSGVEVINTATNTLTTTITVGLTPEGLAISTDGSILYVACFNAGNITAINTKTNTILNTIAVPGGPITLSVSPDGKSIFVEDNTNSTLSVINTATDKIVATVPVGTHPIAFGNFIAIGTGCTGLPITFTITVKPEQIGAIIIPNTFTPNGDGINDTWDIKYLNFYTQCSVRIFTRWGKNVYSSIGYGLPWNGTYGGSPLPTGTYYYVINLNNNTQPLAGFVAIIR